VLSHHLGQVNFQDSLIASIHNGRVSARRELTVFQTLMCHNCSNCQGRQVEAKRLKENRGNLEDEGSPEMESHWQKVLEEKDAESQTRENKLQEQISDLKKKVLQFYCLNPTAVLKYNAYNLLFTSSSPKDW